MTRTEPVAPPRWWRGRRWTFWLGWGLVPPVVLWFVAGVVGAFAVTQPRNRPIPPRDTLAGRAVEDVSVECADGVTARGWLVRAAPDSTRCVVLVAGVGGNRLDTLGRGEVYLEHGWSVLMVDLRGTGASDPERISMGWHEAKDLRAWHGWLGGQGFSQVGAHGESLGAAAVVYSAVDSAWDWLVLEACYLDIDSAMNSRVPWLPLPSLAMWPMHAASQWLLDVDRSDLSPVTHLGNVSAPTMLLYGNRDLTVGDRAGPRMLAASAAEQKRLVWVPGAAHVSLWHFDDALWKGAIAAWLVDREP